MLGLCLKIYQYFPLIHLTLTKQIIWRNQMLRRKPWVFLLSEYGDHSNTGAGFFFFLSRDKIHLEIPSSAEK